MASTTRIYDDLVLLGIQYMGQADTTGATRTLQVIGSATDIVLNIIPKGAGTVRVPAGYEANVSNDQDLINRKYFTTKLAGKNIDALVAAPTVAQDGYAITWDNATATYKLTAVASAITFNNGLTKTASNVKLGGTDILDATTDVKVNANAAVLYIRSRFTSGVDEAGLKLEAVASNDNNATLYSAGGSIKLSPSTIVVTAPGTSALSYAADYGANFTVRSMPDVAWINAHIGGKNVDGNITAPTGAESGYVIGWQNASLTYKLIPFPTPATGYTNVEDEGVAVTQRSIMNFVGSAVTVTDIGGKTTVTISVPASNPFADNVALVKNNADATKLAIFSAASISTLTTRTYTLPNANGTLALTSDLTNYYVRGGNTFGGASVIGLTDNFALTLQTGNANIIFKTNSADRIQLDTSGHFSPSSANNQDNGIAASNWRSVYSQTYNIGSVTVVDSSGGDLRFGITSVWTALKSYIATNVITTVDATGLAVRIGATAHTAIIQAKGAGTSTGELFRLDDLTPTNRLLVLDNGKTVYNTSFTAAGTNEIGYSFTGTLTSDAVAADVIKYLSITPTLVAGANNQILRAVQISPTYTDGAFTGVTHTSLRVDGGMAYFSNSTADAAPTARFQIRGSGITTGELFRIDNNTPTNLFLLLDNGNSTYGQVSQSATNTFQSFTQAAHTGGSPVGFLFTGGAHTTLAASTEATDINLNLARTVQLATGALATQRAVRIQAVTYAFVGASTLTTASTVSISGNPIAGANATITNAYALTIENGGINFINNTNGNNKISGTWTATANFQTHFDFTGSYTLTGVVSSTLYAYQYTPTIILGANSQSAIAVRIAPTFTNGAFTSPVNTGLQVEAGRTVMAGGAAVGASLTDATSNITATLTINKSSSSNGNVFAIQKGATQVWLVTQEGRFTLGGIAGIVLNSGDTEGFIKLTAPVTANGSGTSSASQLYVTGTVTAQANSNTLYGLRVISTFDAVSFTPIVYGIYYNPTITGSPSAHYAIAVNSGLSGFGTLTPTARLQVKGVGTTNGELFRLDNNTPTNIMLVLDNGNYTYSQVSQSATNTFQSFTQAAHTGGSPVGFLFTGGAHTTLAASTEATDINLNLARTVQLATGALTRQRAVLIQSVTYGFVGASTITDAITLAVKGTPGSGTNATITNPYSFAVLNSSDSVEVAITNHNVNFGGLIFGNLGGASAPSIGAATDGLTYNGGGTNMKFQTGSLAASGRIGYNFSSRNGASVQNDSSFIASVVALNNSNSGTTSTHKHLNISPVFQPSAGTSLTLNLINVEPTYNINVAVTAAIVVGINYNPTLTLAGSNTTHYAAVFGSGLFGIGILTPSARLHLNELTLGNEVFRISSVATNDDPTAKYYQNRVATTDATVTVLHNVPIPATTTVMVRGYVVARRTGGSAGTAEDGAGYSFLGIYKNVAGTATLIGTSDIVSKEDQAGWDVTLVVNAASIDIKVTGAVNNNITWHLSELIVSPVST